MAVDYFWIYSIIAAMLFPIFLAISLALLWFSDIYRAKIGNLMNKNKNYGIIDIAERGNKISSHVVAFSETIAPIGKRVFIIPAQVRVKYSVPHAYFPYNDAIRNIITTDTLTRIKDVISGKKIEPEQEAVKERALDDSDFQKPRAKAQDPEVLNAAIMAVKAEAEAEADAKLKNVTTMVYVIALASVIGVILGYMVLDKSGAIQGMVQEVLNKIPTVIKG